MTGLRPVVEFMSFNFSFVAAIRSSPMPLKCITCRVTAFPFLSFSADLMALQRKFRVNIPIASKRSMAIFRASSSSLRAMPTMLKDC